jgi:hypothetical protein
MVGVTGSQSLTLQMSQASFEGAAVMPACALASAATSPMGRAGGAMAVTRPSKQAPESMQSSSVSALIMN